MRMTVLVLAAVGGLASGALGLKWVSDAAQSRELVREIEKLGIAPDAVGEVTRVERAGYLLLVSMLAGFGAAAAVYLGKEKVAGPALLAAVVIPALFTAKALVGTFLLLVAGGLCFALKPGRSVREQAETYLRRVA
ncbi:hypothetical protein J0H58_36510 [bacterium]|nr:hypothetical protein [bacterium]